MKALHTIHDPNPDSWCGSGTSQLLVCTTAVRLMSHIIVMPKSAHFNVVFNIHLGFFQHVLKQEVPMTKHYLMLSKGYQCMFYGR